MNHWWDAKRVSELVWNRVEEENSLSASQEVLVNLRHFLMFLLLKGGKVPSASRAVSTVYFQLKTYCKSRDLPFGLLWQNLAPVLQSEMMLHTGISDLAIQVFQTISTQESSQLQRIVKPKSAVQPYPVPRQDLFDAPTVSGEYPLIGSTAKQGGKLRKIEASTKSKVPQIGSHRPNPVPVVRQPTTQTELLSSSPVSQGAVWWDARVVFAETRLLLEKQPDAQKILDYLKAPSHIQSFLQALRKASLLASSELAIDEFHEWFIFFTYPHRLEWSTKHLWIVLRSTLEHSINLRKKQQKEQNKPIKLPVFDSSSGQNAKHTQPLFLSGDPKKTLPLKPMNKQQPLFGSF